MRTLLLALVVLAVAAPAPAAYLGPTAPAKPGPAPVAPAPAAPRQGGDTFDDAFVVPWLPFTDTGTTVGYADDYSELCPYGSSAPDVVYAFATESWSYVDVDLCGSDYDTKVMVYDADHHLMACNDDYYFDEPCGIYVSKIEGMPVASGATYFVVIDGYGSYAGDYVVTIEPTMLCEDFCLPGELLEGEPPLLDGQPNAFNDGCSGDNPDGFQWLLGDTDGVVNLCGVSGWFTYQDLPYRDTDWFTVVAGPGGVVHAELFAEWPTHLFTFAGTDCADLEVINLGQSDCATLGVDVPAAPGEELWLWVGPVSFEPPNGSTPFEFDYGLDLTGLDPEVAAEAATWGGVKSLYR